MNKSFWKVALMGIGTLLLVSACSKETVEPVEINSETDTCANCNMSVADDQHSTEIILTNGKTVIFDDIGCMFKWVDANEDKEINKSFVRDYYSNEWIDVEESYFVYGETIKTPMSFHVVSFKDQSSAEDFAMESEGELLSYKDLQKHEWTQHNEMGHEETDNHGHSEM